MSTSIVVDARGLRCPIPVIRLARAASGLDPGAEITVWTTDPAAEHDVPAWASMRGHTIVDSVAMTAQDVGEQPETPDGQLLPAMGDGTIDTWLAIAVRVGER